MKQAFAEPEPAAPDLSEILSAVGAEAGQARAALLREEKAKGEIRPKRLPIGKRDDGERSLPTPDAMDDESDSKPAKFGYLSPGLRDVIKRHPQFFRTVWNKGTDNALHVPAGWLPALDRALEAMERVQIDMDIQGFSLCSGALTLSDISRHGIRLVRIGENLLNTLLLVTCEICPICGKRVSPPQDDEDDRRSFCDECLSGYDLMPSRWAAEQNRKAREEDDDEYSLVGL